MGSFFTRERFGKPQFIAGGILLLFLTQCLWLMSRGTAASEMDASDLFRVEEGMRQGRGRSIAGTPSQERLEAAAPAPPEIEENDGYDPNHSPLWYLLASLPLLSWPLSWQPDAMLLWGWLMRTPYIVFGLLLGASLWYVARRLYGDAGGYIALALYCFSPTILRQSTLWRSQPEMGAAWGTFGAIFTAIAVAHTLYAPREVVFWNWRRILLLGLSLALAIGCQFSLIILVPLTLALMLYVAPTRRLAAIVIWLVSCCVATLLLYAAYAFHPGIFWQGLRHASFFGMTWRALLMPHAYLEAFAAIVDSGPAVPVALLGALATYLFWRRARYFGNTAPLLIAILFLGMAVAAPHYSGMGFQMMAIPFLFVFIAGISADLLETAQGAFVAACVWGLLAADALWNLVQLARVGRG
jgi:hypothetical protein